MLLIRVEHHREYQLSLKQMGWSHSAIRNDITVIYHSGHMDTSHLMMRSLFGPYKLTAVADQYTSHIIHYS